MSALTVSTAPKPCNILKKRPILSQLYILHAICKKNIVKSLSLKSQNTALRAQNKSLSQELALMEAQLLQLREVVSLQTQQNIQLVKALRESNSPQKN